MHREQETRLQKKTFFACNSDAFQDRFWLRVKRGLMKHVMAAGHILLVVFFLMFFLTCDSRDQPYLPIGRSLKASSGLSLGFQQFACGGSPAVGVRHGCRAGVCQQESD